MSPIITLLSDFGIIDGYAAAMKGVILQICPSATLVDISHEIAPQDVRSAAFILSTTYRYFPPGTVHLAVVDPGVGTERAPLVARAEGHFFVGPDNGIFGPSFSDHQVEVRRIINIPLISEEISNTFHGRDVFAPVAARLAAGTPFNDIGPVWEPLVLSWNTPVILEGRVHGEIIHIDHFGNAVTNIRPDDLNLFGEGTSVVTDVASQRIHGIALAYQDVPAGSLLILAGSAGYMEIAISMGSASRQLDLKTGDPVTISDVRQETNFD